jgi:hypothetical protein
MPTYADVAAFRYVLLSLVLLPLSFGTLEDNMGSQKMSFILLLCFSAVFIAQASFTTSVSGQPKDVFYPPPLLLRCLYRAGKLY